MSDPVDRLIASLVRDDVRAASAYHVPDARGLIKLDAMENPYAWPEAMYAELGRRLRGASINRYPDPHAQGLKRELRRAMGIDARWEVISGHADFYQCTKGFHNALQGVAVNIPGRLLKEYERTNAANAEALGSILNDADFVFIHDPQPAAMIRQFPDRKGKWIWRFHIDASQFSYAPSELTVHRGDTVTIELTSTDAVHGLYVDGGISAM